MLGIFATLVLNILDYIIIIKFYDTFLGGNINDLLIKGIFSHDLSIYSNIII